MGDPYAEFMKSETSKSDLNGKSKPPETKPSESLKRDEAKSSVKESGPKPNVNNPFKDPVVKAEAGEEPAVKVEENVAKTKVNESAESSQSQSEKNKSEKSSDDPAKVRRFSAVIPDDPPTKFMDSPPKDIPVADCDHKEQESDLKHSRGEDLTNGVTENGEKTKAEKKEKKSNGVNNLNKDSAGRPQNNVEPDDLKPKKAGSIITKTGKILKTTKPELSKNGLNKAAEEVITPKKTSTVEPMEVDEPIKSKAKPSAVKKNDMPMGSLLKDLPTSGSASQASNSEPTSARTRVKFAPAEAENSTTTTTTTTPGALDAEALTLTRSILSSNTNDSLEVGEVGAKSSSDSVQQTSKSNLAAVPKSAEKGGTLDAEAIRISNTFLHQGNTGEPLESTKVEKVPSKGILEKTSPKESIPIETVIPQKKEETKRTNIPTKDDVVHETKNTLANQANKVKLVNEPKNDKQDTVEEKEN